MELILIAHPMPLRDELRLVEALFDLGLQHYHLRKPHWGYAETEAFIQAIPMKYRSRLSIHQYHDLSKYELGYIHFAHPPHPQHDRMRWRCGKSVTVSSLKRLRQLDYRFDYAFLVPIFEHIRKSSHRIFHPEDELRELLQEDQAPKIVATGGITPSRAAYCREIGFDGVAVMEYFWQTFFSSGFYQALEVFKTFQEICVANEAQGMRGN